MASSYLLVGNPTAHSGKAEERIQRAIDRMHERGMAVDFLATLPAGGTVAALRDRLDAHDHEVVIYLGGDGTFAEVGKGLLAAKVLRPLGMLPSGTANDQGKSFGISNRADRLDWNLDVIEAGYTVPLDVGRVARIGEDGVADALDEVFHSVGWGLQSDILAQRNRDREAVKRIPLLREIYRDYSVYAGATLNRMLTSYVEPTRFDARVVADGKAFELTGLTDLLINATPVYGGNWVFDRNAKADDGMFELIPIYGRADWARRALEDLRVVANAKEAVGIHRFPVSDVMPVTELEVQLLRKGREQILAQVDGEEWVAGHHFRLTVFPRRMRVIVPAEWEPPWARDR